MVDYDALNAFAIELAKECGDILSQAFHERDHDVVTKASDVDLVTKTDQLIEKTIMDKVRVSTRRRRVFKIHVMAIGKI